MIKFIVQKQIRSFSILLLSMSFSAPSFAQFKCQASAENLLFSGELIMGDAHVPLKTDNLLARKYPQYEGLTFLVSQRLSRLSKFEILGEEKESIFQNYFNQFMRTGLLQLREYNSLLGPSGKNYLEVFNNYYQNSSLQFKMNSTQRKASLRPHVKFESLFAETISDYFAQISNEVYISGNSVVLHRHAELSFDSKFLDVYYVFPQSAIELAMAKKNGEAVLGEVIFFEKGLDSDQKFRFLGRGQITAELFLPEPS